MGGFNTRTKAFKINTAKMHLLSPSGCNPWYMITGKDGSLSEDFGTWNVKDVNEVEARQGKKMVGGKFIDLVAKPPAVPAGSKADPMYIIVRNIQSPDADKFRLDNGINLLAEAINPQMLEECTIDPVERRRIIVASMIAGFENVVYEDDKGSTSLFPFSGKNALFLLTEHQEAVNQLDYFGGNTKKFESQT